MNDLIYVTYENGILMPLFFLSLGLIILSLLAAMINDAHYHSIPKLSVITGVLGLIVCLGSFVGLVSIYNEALDKSSEAISSWLEQDKHISLSKDAVVELLNNDSFDEFLSSNNEEIRISKPFTDKGVTYVLVLENKEMSLRSLSKN